MASVEKIYYEFTASKLPTVEDTQINVTVTADGEPVVSAICKIVINGDNYYWQSDSFEMLKIVDKTSGLCEFSWTPSNAEVWDGVSVKVSVKSENLSPEFVRAIADVALEVKFIVNNSTLIGATHTFADIDAAIKAGRPVRAYVVINGSPIKHWLQVVRSEDSIVVFTGLEFMSGGATLMATTVQCNSDGTFIYAGKTIAV